MRLWVEGAGAGLAAACGLALAGWLALPGYMAMVWEAQPWPEVAAHGGSELVTYGAPSWGSTPALEPQPAAYRVTDPVAEAEADFRRIEAETERSMAAERRRFSELQQTYATEAPSAGPDITRVAFSPDETAGPVSTDAPAARTGLEPDRF